MLKFAHDIAGGQGNLIVISLQSPNFVTEVSGWQIARDGSAEFNDIIIRGGQVIGGTSLYYDGPPANGNLIASISETGGTDPFGNVYLAGFVSYQFGGLTHTQLNGGIISFSGGSGIEGASGGELVLGTVGTNLVSIPFPLASTLVPVEPGTANTPETWHAITLDAGWTSVVTPQYRLLPDGNVQVRGQATHAGTTSATNINNSTPIPSAYWPAANRVYRPPVPQDAAGTVQISTAGVFAMRGSGFTATQVFMDGIYSI